MMPRKCMVCKFLIVNRSEFEVWLLSSHHIEKLWRSNENVPNDLNCIRCDAIRIPPQFYPKDRLEINK